MSSVPSLITLLRRHAPYASRRLACWSVRAAAAAAAVAVAHERPPHRMLVAQEGEAAMARWPIVHGRSRGREEERA
jgi:hypothetical protein